MRPPFVLFDPDSANAAGDPAAGFFDGRTLYGEVGAAEVGTIQTLDEAIELRSSMAAMYGCDPTAFQIIDCNGAIIAV